MGKIYLENEKKPNKAVKASPATVKFLLDYSKALRINKAKGITFENNMN